MTLIHEPYCLCVHVLNHVTILMSITYTKQKAMVNFKFIKTATLVLAASVLTFSSCKRGDKTITDVLTSNDDNGGYATDAAKLESHSNDVISITDVAATTGNSGLRTTSICATVTFDTSGSAHTLTVDFGTGCTGADGKTRSGKLIVAYTGHYKDSASSHTITSSNYTVNGLDLRVHKTVTNMGRNISGNYYYAVTVNDSIVYATDSIASWTGSRNRTWLSGYSTSTRTDDSYEITGITTVTRANGHVFVFTITSPLKIVYGCDYIESGTVSITSSSFAVGRTLNYSYGGGGCDNQAMLSFGTHDYVITLR